MHLAQQKPAYTAMLLIALIALVTCFSQATYAQDLIAIPPLSARVIDTSGTLDAAQTQALEAKLAAFEKARGAQIVVLMVPTTLTETLPTSPSGLVTRTKLAAKTLATACCS